jgi:hypothetical protein
MIGVASGNTLASEDYTIAITVGFNIEDYLSAGAITYANLAY